MRPQEIMRKSARRWELTYTPTAGFSGLDTLIYQICDVANPGVCDTALVVVNIFKETEAAEIYMRYDTIGGSVAL